jgi:ankyrin repeat protein
MTLFAHQATPTSTLRVTQAGNTPLMCAAIGGHVGIIARLLAKGVNKDARNAVRDTSRQSGACRRVLQQRQDRGLAR